MVDVSIWERCYQQNWKGVATEACHQHPAKFAKSLIFKIVEHALAEGWLKIGDTVVDPFGGVALGALPLLLHGIHYVGCELESRFVELGRANLAHWQQRYGYTPGYGQGALVQGDSRELGQVLEHAECLISSPPYAKGTVHDGNGIDWSKARHPTGQTMTPGRVIGNYGTSSAQLGNLSPSSVADAIVSSPPYAGNVKSDYLLSADGKTRARDVKRGYKQGHGCFRGSETYGQAPGQLGHLTTGSVADAILSSPPYANGCAHTGGADPQPQHIQGGPLPYVAYGQDAAQLGNLPPGSVVDAIVSSPPWSGNSGGHGEASQNAIDAALFARHRGSMVGPGYGTEQGQLGAMAPGSLADAIVSSPPYADQQVGTGKAGRTGWRGYTDHGGGTNAAPGQLAALPTGEVTAVISSPPYADRCTNDNQRTLARDGLQQGHNEGDGQTYGAQPGQLAAMPTGEVAAVVQMKNLRENNEIGLDCSTES